MLQVQAPVQYNNVVQYDTVMANRHSRSNEVEEAAYILLCVFKMDLILEVSVFRLCGD